MKIETQISASLDRSGQLLVGLDDLLVAMKIHVATTIESPYMKKTYQHVLQDVVSQIKTAAKENPPPSLLAVAGE